MTNPEVERAIGRMSEMAQQFADVLGDVNAEGRDDRGFVTATCDPGGRLVDIAFTAEARRLQTYDLRDVVLEAAGRAADAAKAALADKVATAVPGTDLFGADVKREAEAQVKKFQQLIDEQREKVEGIMAAIQKRST